MVLQCGARRLSDSRLPLPLNVNVKDGKQFINFLIFDIFPFLKFTENLILNFVALLRNVSAPEQDNSSALKVEMQTLRLAKNLETQMLDTLRHLYGEVS